MGFLFIGCGLVFLCVMSTCISNSLERIANALEKRRDAAPFTIGASGVLEIVLKEEK